MPTISDLSPSPAHANDLITVSGPDIGVCTAIFLELQQAVEGPGGVAVSVVTKQAQLTRITQNSATFTCPNFNSSVRVTTSVRARYVLNAVTTYTLPSSLDVDPPVLVGPPVVVPPQTYGYGIRDAPFGVPLTVQRWRFRDPYDPNPRSSSYQLPINPNKMTSPFPTRKLNSAYTTAVDGQVLLTEGAATPAAWTFGGEIFNAAHYDMLRSWVYERRRRITITDHFGRDIVCVLEKFDPVPALTRIGQGRYWRHSYSISGLAISVGAPTQVPV